MSKDAMDGAGNVNEAPGWEESHSARFLDLGRIYTPRRDELREAFLDLVPAEEDEAFAGAELGIGGGWLTEGVLGRYRRARMVGLDGSAAMLAAAGELLAPFGERAELRPFRLEADDWRRALPDGLRVIVSSLVIHHLDGAGKARLFRDLSAKLEPGGGLLIADVVEPTTEWARRHLARAWNAEVERQAVEFGGDRRAYEQFVADRWNLYEFEIGPDDFDVPSPLPDQLRWLAEAGFEGVDVFWARAGHVLFGGYVPR